MQICENQEHEDLALAAFKVLDRKNQGYLTFEQFSLLCDHYLKPTPPYVRHAIFTEIDANSDGKVTLKDIQRLMKFQAV